MSPKQIYQTVCWLKVFTYISKPHIPHLMKPFIWQSTLLVNPFLWRLRSTENLSNLYTTQYSSSFICLSILQSQAWIPTEPNTYALLFGFTCTSYFGIVTANKHFEHTYLPTWIFCRADPIRFAHNYGWCAVDERIAVLHSDQSWLARVGYVQSRGT